MPEGDTIFRAATTLARALTGSLLTRFETGYAQLASVDDDAPLIGRTVEKIWAHGKHLYMGFSGELILHTHMRMNGSWHIYRPGEAWQRPKTSARIVLGTEKFVAVAFDVPVADFQTAARTYWARISSRPRSIQSRRCNGYARAAIWISRPRS